MGLFTNISLHVFDDMKMFQYCFNIWDTSFLPLKQYVSKAETYCSR